MIFQVISLMETLESMKDTDKYFRAFFFITPDSSKHMATIMY